MKINKENRLTRKFSPLTVIMLVVLILFSVVLIGMLLWTVITSFKPATFSGFKSGTASTYNLPETLHFENYFKVFEKFLVEDVPYPENIGGARTVYIGHMFVYSLLYCVGSSVIQTIVQCVTAYLCARFKYKLSKIIEFIVIIVMTIPIVGSLPAEITLSKQLGLYNHMYGIWVMKANFLGMYFLIFLAAFKSIPMTYTEAAKIDGASNMSIMLKIIFPLVKNVIFTVILVNFITYWKDYQTPMIYINAYPTVTYGLFRIIFDSSSTAGMVSVPIRMTASIIVTMPLIVIFIIFQKRLMGNLTMGGIKG